MPRKRSGVLLDKGAPSRWWTSSAVIFAMAVTAMTAARSAEQEYVDDVRAKLDRETAYLSQKNFRSASGRIVSRLVRESRQSVVLRLEGQRTYAIVATCDKDCDDVRLSLWDGEGKLLSETSEKNDTVILNGAVENRGLYEARISIPGCRMKECHIGLVVFQQGGTSTDVIVGTPALNTASLPKTVLPKEVPREKERKDTSANSSARYGGPRCSNTETSCSAARNHCTRTCMRNPRGGGPCVSDCQSAYQLCIRSGDWSTRNCRKTGLARQ